MRGATLIRYITVVYLGAILVTTLGLTVLVVAATTIEGGTQLNEAGASPATILKLALLNGLSFSYQIMPAASFLAALIAGTFLARRGELLGIEAAGIGPLPLWLGFYGVAAVTTISGYGLGEWVVPRAVRALENTRSQELGGQTDGLSRLYRRRTRWFRSGELVLYLPVPAELGATAFERPSVYRIEDGTLVSLFDAERVQYENGQWHLYNASIIDAVTGQVSVREMVPLPLKMSARDIVEVVGDPRMMGASAIRALIDRRERAGIDVTSHRIELADRTAYPLNTIWMLTVALPWALRPDRKRSLAVTMGGGVVAIAVLFVAMYFFRLLALSHALPPWLGAFGILSICLVLVPVSAWAVYRFRVRGGLL